MVGGYRCRSRDFVRLAFVTMACYDQGSESPEERYHGIG